MRDQQVTVADVFVDLPFGQASFGSETVVQDDEQTTAELLTNGASQDHVVAHLITRFDAIATSGSVESKSLDRLRRVVLIGGPGQGKSSQEIELQNDLRFLNNRGAELGLSMPRARRWPIRIILSDLADSLARSESLSLLDYIAQSVSQKSTTPVTPLEMRRWLGTYPWLVLIDGLDEVPKTSNRQEVLKAINEFSLEVAAMQADVAVVATTRPQGYGEEFNPSVYTHLELSALPLDKALEYAKGFIAIRAGSETIGARRILERLVRASKDPTTARLFGSPLQISILTILIEKLGQVPRDRWRLFSQYYRVIQQRELEKGGELAELLQIYETDVDFIHREIGDLLQRRSAEAGANSAAISKAEFIEIISKRLHDQGHSPETVAALSAEFSRLVTDRLVFLAMINADRVGFEIRSLQEFMAGEFVTNLPEAEIVEAIQERARDPFWRNVILFSIGCIFAEKEHLKADVANLCASLDLEDRVSAVLKPGAVLALDILLDGSCHSQPRYAKPLAERAASLLEGPPNPRIKDFAKLAEGEVGGVLSARVRSKSAAPPNVWLNRALALTAFVANGSAPQVELTLLFVEAPSAAIRTLIRLAADSEDIRLDIAASERMNECSPIEFVTGGRDRYAMSGLTIDHPSVDHESAPSPFLDALRGIYGAMHFNNEIEFSAFSSDRNYLRLSLTPLAYNRSDWTTLSQVPFREPEWLLLKAIAQFCSAPSPEALAEALETLAAAAPRDRLLGASGAWVLAACVAAAEAERQLHGVEAAAAYLVSLAGLAREGELGELTDWEAAENRWREQDVVEGSVWLSAGDRPDGVPAGAPVWPQLSSEGLPAFGLNVSMQRLETDEQREEVIGQVQALLDTLDHGTEPTLGAFRLQSACFVASIMFDRVQQVSGVIEGSPARSLIFESVAWQDLVSALIRHSKMSKQLSLAWIDWLPSGLNASSQELREFLAALGASPRIRPIPETSGRDFSFVIQDADSWDRGWLQYRLMAHIDISKLCESAGRVLEVSEQMSSESGLAVTFVSFLRLATAQPEEIASGSLDDDLRRVMFNDDGSDSVDLSMLFSDFSTDVSLLTELWCRGVVLACERQPEFALPFVAGLERIGGRNRVPVKMSVSTQ